MKKRITIDNEKLRQLFKMLDDIDNSMEGVMHCVFNSNIETIDPGLFEMINDTFLYIVESLKSFDTYFRTMLEEGLKEEEEKENG